MTLGCDDGFISRWTRAYAADGLAGLVSHHPGRAPLRPVAELEARVLDRTLASKPRDGSTHWSSRKLGAELGDVSFSAVQRIWRKHGVRPHRLDIHMIWDDPDFEAKAARGQRSVPAATRARVTPARTTPAIRAEIAARRASVNDLPHTPHRLQTTLSPAQEVIVVELRKSLLLPLDDLVAVTKEFICPKASRCGLDRGLHRHGLSNLHKLKPIQPKSPHKPFKSYVPGYLHVDIKYLPQMADETARVPTGEHAFDQLCTKLGIEHRLTKPRTPQTNGMVERFNGRISDVLQSHHFVSGEDLAQTLYRYVLLYNQQTSSVYFRK